MHRFTDVDSFPRKLTPVYGYLAYPLVPLQKALEPIASEIDQLDRFSKIAKSECCFPSEHGLTREESAAIFLYTMDWGEHSFYRILNRALRAEDRSSLKPWFGYLKLFDTAIQKLPNVQKHLWRGIAGNIAHSFKKDDKLTWWSISSCSTSVNIIKDFLGSNSTLFLIEAVNEKDISRYSNFPNEDEVILSLGTRLRVLSDPLQQPSMNLVHLREITDCEEEPPSNTFHSMVINPAQKRIQTDPMSFNIHTPKVQTHTTKTSNTYDVKVHILHNQSHYCRATLPKNTIFENSHKEGLKDFKVHGVEKLNFSDGSFYE